MKLRKFFFFTLIFTALLFCISCKGKEDKYTDLDDNSTQDNDTNDLGDTVDDSSDTEFDDSADSNSDDFNEVSDESEENDQDQTLDDDSFTSDEDNNEPDDQDDPVSDDDNTEEPLDDDSISEKDDPVVVCTGQKKCFNDFYESECPTNPESDFYGQDWQYAKKGYCLNKSFSTTTELVTDNLTGLIWQRNLPETYDGCTGYSGAACTHQEAVNYCEQLTYGTFSDWRLPTPEEFGTIVDFGGSNPAFDSDIFHTQQTTIKTFWTKTASLYSNGKAWTLDFTRGETKEETASSNYFYIRCVRGNTLPHPVFQISGAVVEDSLNNLTWTATTGNNVAWQKALNYCQNLEYAGEKGWRLPNVNELKTILDYSSARPASSFPDIPLALFWSSTSYTNYSGEALYVNSSDGTIKTMDKTYVARVLCVK